MNGPFSLNPMCTKFISNLLSKIRRILEVLLYKVVFPRNGSFIVRKHLKYSMSSVFWFHIDSRDFSKINVPCENGTYWICIIQRPSMTPNIMLLVWTGILSKTLCMRLVKSLPRLRASSNPPNLRVRHCIVASIIFHIGWSKYFSSMHR